MVLVGNGGSKEGHDAIAHDLVHHPVIQVYGRHQAFEHRVENCTRLLGVAVGEQLHGALQIGKQHGDLLALAFEGGFGGENFLG
jgi:hypothetical protein